MTSFFQDCKSLTLATRSFIGHIDAEREARNEFETHLYRQKEPKKETPSKPSSSHKPNRDKNLTENSKFNIALLANKNENHPFLEKTLVALIDEIYKDAPFYQKLSGKNNRFSEKFVAELLFSLRAMPKEKTDLTNITFKTPAFQEIWYVMLKGTKYSSAKKKEGIPSLLSFLTIHPDKNRLPICFSKAPSPLLNAIFGNNITAHILETEDEEKAVFSETKLSELLSQKGGLAEKKYFQMNPHLLLEKTKRGVDTKTGIISELKTDKKVSFKEEESEYET